VRISNGVDYIHFLVLVSKKFTGLIEACPDFELVYLAKIFNLGN